MTYESTRKWIGLTDSNTEMTFEWIDDSELLYTNWRPGEPNEAGSEDCVEIWDVTGVWNDKSCGVSNHIICQS